MADDEFRKVLEQQKLRKVDEIIPSERRELYSKAIELTEVLRRMRIFTE